jgi:hypothetical protein
MRSKKTRIFNTIFLLSLLGFCLVFAPAGQAQVVNTGGVSIPNPVNTNTFEGLVQNIAKWFYMIMTPVAVIVILYAAFLFLTSAGDEEKVRRAKRALTYAVVGIAIILIGAGFITLVKSLLGAS